MFQLVETLIVQKVVCMKQVPALYMASWTFLACLQPWMNSSIFSLNISKIFSNGLTVKSKHSDKHLACLDCFSWIL